MVSDRISAERRLRLNALYADYAADPGLAHLLPGTNGVIPGDGPTDPLFILVDESPTRTDNNVRRPGCGASGEFLNELLASVNIPRSRIWLTYVVKVWTYVQKPPVNSRSTPMPKRNRVPTNSERQSSIPYFRREVAILGSPPIVILGKHTRSAVVKIDQRYLNLGNPELGMKMGEWTTALGVPMLPLYHPSYGIYQRSNRPMMFDMFKAVLNPPKVN